MSWLKKLYQGFPLVRELQQIRDAIWALRGQATHHLLMQRESFFRHLLATGKKYQDPRALNHYEFQSFSQNGEDGLIAEIFRRIGPGSRFFVECGVGEGLENNTVFLLRQGWKGAWIEGDGRCAQRIQAHLAVPLASGQLQFLREFVTAENINALFQRLNVPNEFDLLSLDIDRNTSHAWRALRQFRPRVVVIEYNATFPPHIAWEVPYAADRAWNRTTHFGASLKALEQLGQELGYALVGCDFSGTNAFFVRADLDLAGFAGPLTAEALYEPPRYWTGTRAGHAPGFSD